ncbi:MAG: hypothetical protein KQH59_18180 [Desulfobulbaceae bacterium]|nr:hypothetical protein [Desulfobulbaceae bacterium]
MSLPLPSTGVISLGGIALCDNLVLRGLRAARVVIDKQPTKGGKLIALANHLSGGRSLELYGHYTTAQADALQAIEGTDVPLVHPRGTFTVMIEGNDLVPLWDHLTTAADTDIEIGSIFLLER